MLHMTIRGTVGLLLLSLTAACAPADDGAECDPGGQTLTALEATAGLVGSYSGSWTLYGAGTGGGPVPVYVWTDVITAANPQLVEDRAQVSVTDVLTFSDSSTFTVNSTEGYLAGCGGFRGERYFEVDGVVTIETELSPTSFSFAQPVEAQELMLMGFPTGVLFAEHVSTKTVTNEGGIETEWISRMTTVEYDDAGTLKTEHFVSLDGFHTRPSP